MKLKNLFEKCGIYNNNFDNIEKIEIADIEFDSRKVKENTLFLAVKGFTVDGNDYVQNAFDNGASVCIINKENESKVKNKIEYSFHNRIFCVEDTKSLMPIISRAFFDYPDKKMNIIGITGTKGKTTTTYIIKHILELAGNKVGLIGTINHFIGNKKLESKNTTPDSLDLYKLIYQMHLEGCQYLVMEISSHALSLNRVSGLELDVAIFNNFSQDHLDFHLSMEEYLKAKLKIFDILKNSSKKNKFAVINRDIPKFENINQYAENLNLNIITYSIEKNSKFKGLIIDDKNFSESIFNVENDGNIKEYRTNLIGDFNIYNSLCSIAVTKSLNIKEEYISEGLKKVIVIGRFEKINMENNNFVIIDYAHTENALENVLTTIKNLKPNKIITVFGCGGNRDKLKRPLMGAAVAKYSDEVIVTNDNPRFENPKSIIEDIIPGIQEYYKNNSIKNFNIIEDRKEAIYYGISLLLSIKEKYNILLIAGKGHEDYQIFGNKKIHFSDKEVVLEYCQKIKI